MVAHHCWGGFYERVIKSVKSSLKKILGVKFLTKSELETVLIEIESCVNSRPLTYVSTDTNTEIITPSQFLMSKNITDKIEFSEEFENIIPSILKEKLELKGQMIDIFWKIWANEYLQSLPKIVAKFEDKSYLKKGSIVLVKTDNVPRLEWPKGIVVRTFPSQDGLIRSAEIKTAKNTLIRPIQNLVDRERNNDASERITEMIDPKKS